MPGIPQSAAFEAGIFDILIPAVIIDDQDAPELIDCLKAVIAGSRVGGAIGQLRVVLCHNPVSNRISGGEGCGRYGEAPQVSGSATGQQVEAAAASCTAIDAVINPHRRHRQVVADVRGNLRRPDAERLIAQRDMHDLRRGEVRRRPEAVQLLRCAPGMGRYSSAGVDRGDEIAIIGRLPIARNGRREKVIPCRCHCQ